MFTLARPVHTGTPTWPDGSTVLTIDTPGKVTAALALLQAEGEQAWHIGHIADAAAGEEQVEIC